MRWLTKAMAQRFCLILICGNGKRYKRNVFMGQKTITCINRFFIYFICSISLFFCKVKGYYICKSIFSLGIHVIFICLLGKSREFYIYDIAFFARYICNINLLFLKFKSFYIYEITFSENIYVICPEKGKNTWKH